VKKDHSELTLALVWIAIYIVAMSLADEMSARIGIEKIITAPVAILLVLGIYITVKKQRKEHYLGLNSLQMDKKQKGLLLVIFGVVASVNLWHGIQINFTLVEMFLIVTAMLCVAFLEELIFRGLLFRALLKNSSVFGAILIASITFGLGHIVNLLNGAEFLPTLLQLIYASCAGLMFTMFVYKTNCLWPCMVCHGVVNSLSIFAQENLAMSYMLVDCVLTSIICLAYSIYLWRWKKEEI